MEFETAALARVVPNRNGFFTPLFRTGRSNLLHIQEYDREHRIERFIPIEDNTTGIEELPIRRVRQVGDEALFGFISTTEDRLLGTRAEIAAGLRRDAMQLEGTRLLKDISAFFAATSMPILLKSPAPPTQPILVIPGGPLPINALNYVKRAADNELDELLSVGRSPASIIVAPINGGSSSFLNRVYQRAQTIRDNWVCIVHLDEAFSDEEKFTRLDLFRYLFRKLGLPDDKLVHDVESMRDAFEAWARHAWSEASRVVLIIDGLDQVFKNPGSIADPLALINWLSGLRSEAASGKPPYNKLAIFTALVGKTWSAAHASPYATQASELRLRKFSVDEVREVFAQLGLGPNLYSAEEAHFLFHGHPYLTQLFAWSIREGSTVSNAVRAALSLEGHYGAHWDRMKSEIRFLIGTNYELTPILRAVSLAVKRSTDQPLDKNARRIWDSYGRDLRVFGLVDGSAQAPTVCEFYRNAIESE